MAEEHQQSIQVYIHDRRREGMSDQDIFQQLVQAGWDQNEVTRLLSQGVPQPPAPMPVNQYAQTGNAGTPLQVENVQYSMRVKPVVSKVGMYIRFAMLGLWVSVIAVCTLLANLISKSLNHSMTDLGAVFVAVISILIIAVPIFWIGNSKLRKALAADSRLVDDLFFKKQVRASLRIAVVLTALVGFGTVYGLLSMLFLHNSTTSGGNVLESFIFFAGFGGVLAYTWLLHTKTRR